VRRRPLRPPRPAKPGEGQHLKTTCLPSVARAHGLRASTHRVKLAGNTLKGRVVHGKWQLCLRVATVRRRDAAHLLCTIQVCRMDPGTIARKAWSQPRHREAIAAAIPALCDRAVGRAILQA
jgi:hypothetical protein